MNKKFTMKKISIIFALIFANITNCFAWSGYEETTNIQIDIPPGNLVRVGREINIYDFSDKKYHNVEVMFMDDIFVGTKLDVKDYETKKRRIFYMDRS